MIRKIQIQNYKSIDALEFDLGRVNLLIGENGAGKSNILEAIAMAGAAAANKLDNEFLTSRGIRVTQPEHMRPAFPGFDALANILIKLSFANSDGYECCLSNSNAAYSKWVVHSSSISFDANLKKMKQKLVDIFEKNFEKNHESLSDKDFERILEYLRSTNETPEEALVRKVLTEFIIYSPENSTLRTTEKEGQIEPLGIKGEGLLKFLSVLFLYPEYAESLQEIKTSLQVLGWFEDLRLTDLDSFIGSHIEIRDRYLDKNRCYFDQLSTNEGFLFLLFYFALFCTDLTPKFFAIDNIDASLNPKLCEKLMLELVKLAEKHDKQVILTAHNPALLDGLNLDDDEQRLFVVSRNADGATRMKRVSKRKTPAGERPSRLSELFLRGILGGLPKEF